MEIRRYFMGFLLRHNQALVQLRLQLWADTRQGSLPHYHNTKSIRSKLLNRRCSHPKGVDTGLPIQPMVHLRAYRALQALLVALEVVYWGVVLVGHWAKATPQAIFEATSTTLTAFYPQERFRRAAVATVGVGA